MIPPFMLVLYRFDKNLLRVVRTCAAFGVGRIVLVECPDVEMKPPYVAMDRVIVTHGAWADVPRPRVGMRLDGRVLLSTVDWSSVRALVVGGVHAVPPVRESDVTARIDGAGRPEFMTKDAAAIGLYAWAAAGGGP